MEKEKVRLIEEKVTMDKEIKMLGGTVSIILQTKTYHHPEITYFMAKKPTKAHNSTTYITKIIFRKNSNEISLLESNVEKHTFADGSTRTRFDKVVPIFHTKKLTDDELRERFESMVIDTIFTLASELHNAEEEISELYKDR